MIRRTLARRLRQQAAAYPVVAVTGPRQSGKTTLVRACFPRKPYVSLEDLDTRQFAREDPRGFLAGLPRGAILDEVQHAPGLLSYMQTIVDARRDKGVFILTGSNQFLLMAQVAQSLAGRIAILRLLPLTLSELGAGRTRDVAEVCWRGGYPRVHADGLDPADWYRNYLETYLEKDLKDLLRVHDLLQFRKLLAMLASQCGQLLNLSALGASLGLNHNTVRAWLAALEQSCLVFQLPPFHRNFQKRLVKTPKVYFYDTGLACALLRLHDPAALADHYLRGALFENLVVSELHKEAWHRGVPADFYFWRDHTGHEVDLLREANGRLYPVEIKAAQTVHDDFFSGLRDFGELAATPLPQAAVVYGGQAPQTRHGVQVIGWRRAWTLLGA